MANCKIEFMEEVTEHKLLCAKIAYDPYATNPEYKKCFKLRIGFSITEYNNFLNQLDFEYDDSYGAPELFGIIWYEDGTWSERYYGGDGDECWEYKQCPEIPKELT